MKCVTFNVNGIRAILQKGFAELFYALDADIFSLNETKFTEEEHHHFPFEPEDYFVYWTNSKVRKGYSGVAVFTKKQPLSVYYGLKQGAYDDEGRIITLEYETFYYVACYVPNAGDELKRLSYRLQFEKDLQEYLVELDFKKPVIYAGDFNVAHQEIDLKNPKENHNHAGFTNEERSAFSSLLSKGFIDTFRFQYPSTVCYSWWSYRFQARIRNAGWRIDYFLVSQSLKDKIQDTIIHTEILGSDHCPVELILD